MKTANTERDTTPVSPSWAAAPEAVPPQDNLASDSSSYSVSPDLGPLQSHASANASPMESPQDLSPRASFDIAPMVLPSPRLPLPSNRASQHFDQAHIHGVSTTPSPMILPQQAVASPANNPSHRPDWGGDTSLDHEATTALLMLNNDRRQPQPSTEPSKSQGGQRKLGISVHDLLTH